MRISPRMTVIVTVAQLGSVLGNCWSCGSTGPRLCEKGNTEISMYGS